MIMIYTPCKDKTEAKKIAMYLLKKKLISCANIFPITSVYRWKGKIINDNEHVLIAKTKDSNLKKVENEIKKIHSYELPAILNWKFKSNSSFKDWMKKEAK